jgi:hypothetical protein
MHATRSAQPSCPVLRSANRHPGNGRRQQTADADDAVASNCNGGTVLAELLSVVGLAENDDGSGESPVFATALTVFDEQDRALGQDTSSVSTAWGATVYGGLQVQGRCVGRALQAGVLEDEGRRPDSMIVTVQYTVLPPYAITTRCGPALPLSRTGLPLRR